MRIAVFCLLFLFATSAWAGNRAKAEASAVNVGPSADADVDVNFRVGAYLDSYLRSSQGNQQITQFEAQNIEEFGRHHAESAANSYGMSAPVQSPCGDVNGGAGQTGPFGLSLAMTSEACRAYRIELLKGETGPENHRFKFVEGMEQATRPVRVIFHLATLGIFF